MLWPDAILWSANYQGLVSPAFNITEAAGFDNATTDNAISVGQL